MVKLKWLKSYKGSEIGSEFESGKKSAINFISQGYAEYVEEKPKQVKEKPKNQKKSKTKENQNVATQITVKLPEQKSYECTKCSSIIKSSIKPKNCSICSNSSFNILTVDNKDIRLEVLSFFNRKEFGQGTELLVKAILNINTIFTTKVDKAQEIYYYKEGIYLPEGESHIKSQLRIIMVENYSEWLANQVIAKIKTDTFIGAETFFEEKNHWEIAVENGILNLKSIELQPFTPEKIFFNKLPVKYDPLVRTDKIDQFLSEVLASNDDKKVFYELAGFGLVKDYFLEKSIMFVGNGRNGKSKAIELLKRLVGAENCASVPLSSLTSTSPFVQMLWKKYFNLAGDISSEDLKETGMFKQLTGRDPISANRKYKNVIQFTNHAKLVFACNELPRVYDYSDGFWERWLLLEFPYKFVEQSVYDASEDKENLRIKDNNIINKITTPEEMSGLLNEAVIGLHNILQEKKFSYSKGTSEVKENWIRKADSFMAFCMDYLEEDYEGRISKRNLSSVYKNYCSKHKVTGTSDKSIKVTLQERFGVGEEYTSIAGLGKQEWFWVGVRFNNKEVN